MSQQDHTNHMFKEIGKNTAEFVPAESSNMGDFLAKGSLNFALLGHLEVLRTLGYIIFSFFSFFIVVFLRHTLGSNRISLVTVVMGITVINVCGGFLELMNPIGAFLGFQHNWSLIYLFSKIFAWVGLAHWVHYKYRKHFKPNQRVYSYSYGISWGYIPYRKLSAKYNFKYLQSESAYQSIVEPFAVIAVGAILSYGFNLNLGTFLMICGFSLYQVHRIQQKNFYKELVKMTDSQIVNSQFIKAIRDEPTSVSEEGLVIGQTVVNQVKRANLKRNEKLKGELEEALEKMMKEQTFD